MKLGLVVVYATGQTVPVFLEFPVIPKPGDLIQLPGKDLPKDWLDKAAIFSPSDEWNVEWAKAMGDIDNNDDTYLGLEVDRGPVRWLKSDGLFLFGNNPDLYVPIISVTPTHWEDGK